MASVRRIVSDRYPYLPIRVNVRRWEIEAYALIDTGFTGSLAVPSELLNQTTEMPDSRVRWALADASIIDAPIYLGDVEIVGFTPIPGISITFLGEEFVLGRGIIDRFRVTLDYGRRVIVEK